LTRMHNMHTVAGKWILRSILPRRRGICVSTACPLRMRKACLWTLLQCIALIQTLRARSDTGRGSAGHLLVVVYTLRGDSIRLISVRRATPAENRTYES
jgi:hypothetical protein